MKRICERDADRLNRAGAAIRIFRLTNVYGGLEYLERKNTVVKKFLLAKRENSDIIINGDGSQIRDFIHVEDVCEAIYLCMQRKEKMLRPVDIGTGIGTSIIDLAKMFNHRLTFVPDSDTIGASESIADTKRAEKLFGFKAKHSLLTFIEKETDHV
jgi:nucleoside-diphosphate-sugar epimerase